jgi:hypothetical protein
MNLDVARRLTDYAVLIQDPETPSLSATYYELSTAAYQSVRAEWDRLARSDDRVARAYHELGGNVRDVRRYRLLLESLTVLLDREPVLAQQIGKVIADADQQILIDHFLGDRVAERSLAEPVTVDTMRAHLATRPAPPPLTGDESIQVVIPLRDPAGGGRLRNLLACLAALRDQAPPGPRYYVSVVESDEVPRWRDLVEPLVQHYLFLPHRGRFNKSWTVNAGVVNAPVPARLICVLDADILVDRRFLARNTARFADAGAGAHLPYLRYTNLDADSTHAAIRARCLAGAADVCRADIRAHILREPPGGCMWVTAAAFHAIGGFDERFRGWGGEDNDVVARLIRHGGFRRYDDELWHMDHPRPVMRMAGKALNGHLTPLTWRPSMGYGRLSADN